MYIFYDWDFQQKLFFTDSLVNGESGFSKCYVPSISGRDNNSELLWIFLHKFPASIFRFRVTVFYL